MKPRERVLAALAHRIPDRVPRFEIWIDVPPADLGQADLASTYVHLGQDCVMLPSLVPAESHAWRDGVDEWGRVWQNGMYVDGVVHTDSDLRRYSTSADYANQLFDPLVAAQVRACHADRCLIYGAHVGPFTAAYMAMGFERFFVRLCDEPAFVDKLLQARTQWCIALCRRAASLGADVIVLGDDAAHRSGAMISPQMWRQHVLPYHRQVVESLDVPVIWHSDGDITPLLPMAIEAGFVGVHGLEPAAGVDLAWAKREFGKDLVLVGNIDVGVLCDADLDAVKREVLRCLEQGAPGGGYMMATCNSIFEGMNLSLVVELFRFEAQVGYY